LAPLLSVTLYFSWVCATGTGLAKVDLSPYVATAIKRRIVMASASTHSADCCACSAPTGA